MKRFWPLPVLLLLALPAFAQEGDDSAPADAPAQEEAAPNAEEPAPDAAPVEPPSAESQPSQDGAESGDEAEKPPKDEPVVNVKVSPSPDEESEEESITPPLEPKKVESTVLLPRPKKAGSSKGSKSAKGAKAGKGKALPPPVKAKAPALPPEPPPPPIPAVPLTPITPRNP